MLTSQRVMMIHKKIIEYHGRIENVKVFDKDPTPFIQAAKEAEEARLKAIKEAERARQLAAEAGEEVEETKEPVPPPAEDEDKEPEYTEYGDPSMTIYEIFQNYGLETRDAGDGDTECQKELFYDFTPYNPKDPVLRASMR